MYFPSVASIYEKAKLKTNSISDLFVGECKLEISKSVELFWSAD